MTENKQYITSNFLHIFYYSLGFVYIFLKLPETNGQYAITFMLVLVDRMLITLLAEYKNIHSTPIIKY